MALNDSQKLDFVWKWMQSRSRGVNASNYFEENIPMSTDVHAKDVFTEVIPPAPPSSTNLVIKKWYAGDAGVINLTVDRKYPGNRVWVALDSFEGTWSSGSGDVNRVLQNFVSPRYGSQYVVKVYDGAGNAIPELDDSTWTFNYRSGVLTFEVDRAENGNSTAACIKIAVYQYVGKNLLNGAPSNADSAMRRGSMIGDCDGLNTDFELPADCDTDLLFIPLVNGQQMFPGADYTQDAVNLKMLHFVDSPDSTGRVDVVYYPILA